MKRFGTVIVFKPEVTKAEARKVLKQLEASGLVSTSDWVSPVNGENYHTPVVYEYEDRFGSPVWYIP